LPNITEHFAHVLLFACPQCERAAGIRLRER